MIGDDSDSDRLELHPSVMAMARVNGPMVQITNHARTFPPESHLFKLRSTDKQTSTLVSTIQQIPRLSLSVLLLLIVGIGDQHS